MLSRQIHRELQRAVLELRRSGFSDDEIRAHENELRQNSRAATARALKEHFILERIAEEEKIEDEPEDYDHEIALIAAQSGESAAARSGPAGKAGLDGQLAESDRRTKGDRPDPGDVPNSRMSPSRSEPADAEAIDQSASRRARPGIGNPRAPKYPDEAESESPAGSNTIPRHERYRAADPLGRVARDSAEPQDDHSHDTRIERQNPIDPRLAYRDYQRQRQMTWAICCWKIASFCCKGEIHDGNANEVVMKLLYLQSENRRKDIHFYINSPGRQRHAPRWPSTTRCRSSLARWPRIASVWQPAAAAVLLAGGTKGKRYALPNAKVMIHQPYGQVGGQVSDIEIQAE